MKAITVREYARLTTEVIDQPSLDRVQVSSSAFDWLCRLSSTFTAAGAPLVQVQDRRWLKLDNYVGVIETPCGTRIEILPKHFEEGDSVARGRSLLQRMIQEAMDLRPREVGETSLQSFNMSISEWVMGRFLAALNHLVKCGVRSDYVRVEASERFLRGQANVVAQLRQPASHRAFFEIRHDIFIPDRPENRLLRRALDHVCQLTQSPSNWRLAQELRSVLHAIPPSDAIARDFSCWRVDRLMAHYQPARPWCELILYQQMPLSLLGEWRGISMLFPMERLFERYVACMLRKALTPDTRVVTQPSRHTLCQHDGSGIFSLEPDIFIERGSERWVVDTKWKRLDASDRRNKYGLSSSDFYQLFAYGEKYLNGRGEMVLIYPRRAQFETALPVFCFNSNLLLQVVPFDLDTGMLLNGAQTSLPLQPAARSSMDPTRPIASTTTARRPRR